MPPPLRNSVFPEGLPQLQPIDMLKVQHGNALARFSATVFQLARSLRIPVALENPTRSWLWMQPCMKA